jgi:hypothetical protein
LQIVTAAARQPFDLSSGNLFRALLIGESEDSHLLVFVVHHIVADLWSMGILVREIFQVYEHLLSGNSSPLAEIVYQHADFACWQRKFLQGDRLAARIRHWKQRLINPPVLNLHGDRPRPPVRSIEGGIEHFTIPEVTTARLRTLSRESNASLFMTCLTGYYELLRRHSGQADLVVGCPYLGRDLRETRDLVGDMVNMLPLRVNLQDTRSFRELLRNVRRVALDAYLYPDLPFAKLVEVVNPPRSSAFSPLFQAVFQLYEDPLRDVRAPGFEVQRLRLDNGTSKFDISLSVRDNGADLHCAIQYSRDLYNAGTAQCLLREYCSILEQAVETLDQA